MSKVINLSDHRPTALAKACREKLEQTDAGISNGAFTKMSGIPIEEITDHEEGSIVLEITLAALPLATAVKHASKIARNALEYQDHENALEINIKAMGIILEVMQQGAFDYNYNLGVARKEERDTADTNQPE